MKLVDLASSIGAVYEGDPAAVCFGVRDPLVAGPSDLAFVDKGLRVEASVLKAVAVLVERGSSFSYANRILVEQPRLAFAQVLSLIYPHRTAFPGVSPLASIALTAQLGQGVSVAPFAVIGDGVVIGQGSEVHPHAVVYPGVRIGRECLLYAGCVLREGVELGDRVIVHPGAVVGADGFGYVAVTGKSVSKVPQVGGVYLADRVEVGANSCIDRGTLSDTRLEADVKLDNLVQVAHNVRVGPRSRLSAQTGISGSVEIGSDVVMGGQVGVADHISIASETMIAAQAGIAGSIKERGIYAGSPHQDFSSWRRGYVHLKKLEQYAERIKALEKRMEDLTHEK